MLQTMVPQWLLVVAAALCSVWVLHRAALNVLAVRTDAGFWDVMTGQVVPEVLLLIDRAKVEADAHRRIKELEELTGDQARRMFDMAKRLLVLEAFESQRAKAQGQLPLE